MVHQRWSYSRATITFAALAVGWSMTAVAETALELDPELAGRVGRNTLALSADSDSPGGLKTALPDGVGDLAQGTVMMRLRSSRRLGHVDETSLAMDLMNCSGVRVQLSEHRDSPRFVFFHPGGSTRPAAVCRIAYLNAGQWYHVALSWTSQTGLVDVFVNGWAQQRVHLPPWQPKGDRTLRFGGTLGAGTDAARIELEEISLHAWPMDEGQLRQAISLEQLADGGSGVRKRYETALDLSDYTLTPLFEPDLSKPLPIIAEDTLFEGEARTREPEPGQWVLEGPAKAFTADGKLTIDNLSDGPAHTVLWLPRAFPANVMLEFDITIERDEEGLAIVFFAARPCGDPVGSIFKTGLAKRGGVFGTYIKGDVDSYHVSYLAAGQRRTAIPGPRRSANVRKNSGFWLVACGDDQILGHDLGRGPHRVRILKMGNLVRVEANGKLSVAFDDDGETWGPVLGDGYIGLRQMNHLLSAQYENLRVYEVSRK
ncbi:MAG: DUF1961 family protein [Lentisphaerae bacterium]|jgi:hypothetical protein|nr:DUF1961 family protein [Lentisphaerota bacterium]MBT5606530.1 DUF1961 family protein [Lentisphaerota bacterium]MBT7055024.1 DUF1961 family protein [Lentisphaerota bacterium]MBT7845342.1 DUF1961 family protein [Lentisphaerota bacterium]